MATIKIRAPERLPKSNVTRVQLKAWQQSLEVFLSQEPHYRLFLPGGHYQTWSAAEDGERIAALAVDAQGAPLDANGNLAERRIQLRTFLSVVGGCCQLTEYNDIQQRSTSLGWIINYLEQNYNIEKKGAHFFALADITFDRENDETHQQFYKRLRGHFLDNTRKVGEVIKYKNNLVLNEDEKISYTLESTIVFMALERIDPRLPKHVAQVYSHIMDSNTTAIDIQPMIFQNLSQLLQDIEVHETNAQAANVRGMSTLNAMQFNKKFNQPRNQDRNQLNRYDGVSRRNAFSGNGSQNSKFNGKFCRICKLAGSSADKYFDHSISKCTRLTSRDWQDFQISLRQQMEVPEETEDEEEAEAEPEPEEEPGWDQEA